MRNKKLITFTLAGSLLLSPLLPAAGIMEAGSASSLAASVKIGAEKPKPTVTMADFIDPLPFYLDESPKDCDKASRTLYELQVGNNTVKDFELESVECDNNKATVKKEGSKWMLYPKTVGDFNLVLKVKETENYQSITHKIPGAVMPKRPKSVKVTSPKKGQVKVTWKNPGGISKVKIDTEAKGEEYKIHTADAGKQSYTIKNLAPGKKYKIMVYGTNGNMYFSKTVTRKVKVKK